MTRPAPAVEHVAALSRSWQRAWSELGLMAPEGLFDQLLAAYQEPQRHYHRLLHLQECLAHFDTAVALAEQPGEVELALWFHDAVYDVRGKDNERRSADWARQALHSAGAAPAVIERVHALIMATCHAALPAAADARLLVDIDLAILGASTERFAEYDREVRAEYSWVPGWLYRFKRRQVLRQFLARAPLFHTAHFRSRLEAQARDNLQRVLGR